MVVRVSYDESQVRLSVRNTAVAAPPDRGLAATGSGLGLASLRQRIELVHGTLRAGRHAGRRVLPGGDPAVVRADGRAGGVSSMVRVVVVDDEPMVCAHLRTILGSAADIEVVDEAHDGAAGVAAVTRSRPDVVLMDLRMPVLDGIAAIERIVKLGDPPVVVVLTTFDADQYVLRALRAGAAGFLVKSTPPEDLIGLVRVAAEGHTVLSPAAARRLIAASADSQPARDRARKLAGSLTEREAEVLACLGEGCPTPRSRRGCSSPRQRSRAMCPGCWTSSAWRTAPRPACWRTTRASPANSGSRNVLAKGAHSLRLAPKFRKHRPKALE